MKKGLSLIFVSLLCCAVLASQSLVEASKKEKERREQLKGKNVKVITNADLKQMTKKSAVTTTVSEPSNEESAEPGATEPAQEPEAPSSSGSQEQKAEGRGEPGFARAVLPETFMVENPEAALNMPDGKYAEISVNGVLDLEISLRNGPGDDIAVYARWAGGQEGTLGTPEGMPLDPAQGIMSYGILGMNESGDLEEIGRGRGISSPEKFDLGSISSIKKILIIFKPPRIPAVSYEFPTLDPLKFTMGIDAVVALN